MTLRLQPDSMLAGTRVLVAEDELIIRMELEAILLRAGCHVIGPAATTDAALDLVGREEIHVAVMNLNLRGVLSTPVASALVERGIPFVIVSAYRREDYESPPLTQGEWIVKPLHENLLIATLQRLTQRSFTS